MARTSTVQPARAMKVILFGDLIFDEYHFGTVERLCPEAPVPAFMPTRADTRIGGAGNVTENLRALGVDVHPYYGSESIKVRYFAGHHMLLRVDKEVQPLSVDLPDVSGFDAVVVSDYNKGGVRDDLAYFVANRARDAKIPLFVDSKRENPNVFYDAFAFFPNQYEHRNTKGMPFQHIVRKLGPRGCEVDGQLIPTTEQQVYDVSGAGDVFMAAFVASWLGHKDLLQAAQFANAAAGISVRHLGTYTVNLEEVEREIHRLQPAHP